MVSKARSSLLTIGVLLVTATTLQLGMSVKSISSFRVKEDFDNPSILVVPVVENDGDGDDVVVNNRESKNMTGGRATIKTTTTSQ
jgi:hypothetical protein